MPWIRETPCIYQSTQCNIVEDLNLHQHRYENLKSRLQKSVFHFTVKRRYFYADIFTKSNLPEFCPSLPSWLIVQHAQVLYLVGSVQTHHCSQTSIVPDYVSHIHNQLLLRSTYCVPTSRVTLRMASDTQKQLYHQTSRKERHRIPRVTTNDTKFPSPTAFQ